MRRRGEHGAAAVETVLVMVFVLVPLLIGITDVGRALYVSITLEEVAQETANFAAFEGANQATAAARAVSATSFPVLSASDVGMVCTNVARQIENGSVVTVDITYTLDLFFFLSWDLRQSATAEGTAPCA